MYDDLRKSYQQTKLPAIDLGGILIKGQLVEDTSVHLVLEALNRHGLIAGATGSGKTKTIQVLAEALSLEGIPSLVMDIKGDLSGLSQPAENTQALVERAKALTLDFKPQAFPVELLSLTSELKQGLPLRATVEGFGALLFARILEANDTQTGMITVLFAYAKQQQLALISLKDIKALLQFAQTTAGKVKIEQQFGALAKASLSTLMRKIIELEAEGGDVFFGEPAFAIADLLRINEQGLGLISILRLLDMQAKPKIFSSFMLKLLTDIYQQLPEQGDLPKPRLILFIDEAHLLFAHASKALLNLLETIVRLIRSKGVGLIFCTQTPNDLPAAILSQLGLKIQHALRAFTAKDRQAIKLVAQNFPLSPYYDTAQVLTTLGIGEALVTALDAKGQPTPLIHCLIRPPLSRMGTLSEQEIATVIKASLLLARYGQEQVIPAAATILAKETEEERVAPKPAVDKDSLLQKLSKNSLVRQILRQMTRELTHFILKALGLKKKR